MELGHQVGSLHKVNASSELIGLTNVDGWGYIDHMSEGEHDSGTGLVTEEVPPKLAQPPQYRVVMLNDDFTPMEFVVHVLEHFFYHIRERAVQIMLQIHQTGRGVAGVFPAEVAETKVAQVNAYARKHQHPLLTVMEKA